MRVLIIGAGAVGGVLAARLLQAGKDVTLVARGAQAEAIQLRGITLRTPEGIERVPVSQVRPLSETQGRFDVVLIGVKASALREVCDELPNRLQPHGIAVPLLNGLDSEHIVAEYAGAQRTLACVVYVSSAIVAPGEIALAAPIRVGLAPYRPGQDAIIASLARLLESSGVPVRRASDAPSLLWEKMVWNAPFNAICALTRKHAGWVADHMEPLVRDAMREVLDVATSEGVILPSAIIDLMLQVTRKEFPNTEPSMLQDVQKGQVTEVDILQGAVVERGKRAGIETPVLRTLATLIRGLT